ncbi:C4-type zinc ribbon domain-containing protein [Prevotella sp.]|uniref:zinc ribbon domain-containing protein n=1 Tax=uncultured Prevotella sp. TaxID=159272 RepID=UPI0025D3F594|nr:C4-type zinc ribbon domain-containing protein [Prevotella sp.]MCI7118827.1 C4-type zinc ribbon domain-containing protein [Prevotella sp.]
MAKKESEISVEEKLSTLYQLQTTLSAIDEKRALRGELPLEVQDLEDEIAGLKTRIEKIENDITDFQQAVVQKQGEIKEAEESVERYKKQLDEVRNNREYDTLTKEIEFQSLEIELCNKKIREANVKVEDKKRELARTNDLVADRQQALEEKKNELDEIMLETREEEQVLKAKAEELETKIDPRLLSSFKRIRKNARNGLGIVYVQRDACGGCFNKIPPQRQLDIKMHKKIIVCEYCGRIMIDPELAGVKTAVEEVVEDKPKRKRATTRKTAASKKSEESETKLS